MIYVEAFVPLGDGRHVRIHGMVDANLVDVHEGEDLAVRFTQLDENNDPVPGDKSGYINRFSFIKKDRKINV